jgi:hypothetical protein
MNSRGEAMKLLGEVAEKVRGKEQATAGSGGRVLPYPGESPNQQVSSYSGDLRNQIILAVSWNVGGGEPPLTVEIN